MRKVFLIFAVLGLVTMSSASIAFTAWVVIPASQTDINTTQLQNPNHNMEDNVIPGSKLQTDALTFPDSTRPYYYPSKLRPKVREGLENKTGDHKCVDYNIDKEAVNTYRGVNITLDKVSLYTKEGIFCTEGYLKATGYEYVFDTVHITEEPKTYLKDNLFQLLIFISILAILSIVIYRHH